MDFCACLLCAMRLQYGVLDLCCRRGGNGRQTCEATYFAWCLRVSKISWHTTACKPWLEKEKRELKLIALTCPADTFYVVIVCLEFSFYTEWKSNKSVFATKRLPSVLRRRQILQKGTASSQFCIGHLLGCHVVVDLLIIVAMLPTTSKRNKNSTGGETTVFVFDIGTE